MALSVHIYDCSASVRLNTERYAVEQGLISDLVKEVRHKLLLHMQKTYYRLVLEDFLFRPQTAFEKCGSRRPLLKSGSLG